MNPFTQLPTNSFPQSAGHNIPDGRPDYAPHIIKSAEPNVTEGRISDTLFIDSRDRNYVNYPSSNSYKLSLNKQYRDVIAIELTKGMVPNSGFYIGNQNNSIVFNEALDTTQITTTIPTGYYTKDELFTQIGTSMTSATGATLTYTVSDNPTTKQVIISSSADFVLYFKSTTGEYAQGSIAPVLGYPPQNFTSSDSYTATSPFCESIDEPYVCLHLKEATNMHSTSRGADQAFAVIPMLGRTTGCEREFFGKQTAHTGKTTKHFNPPISRINELTISFKRHDGTLYDFNGKEHFLEFDIYTLNAKQKYRHTP